MVSTVLGQVTGQLDRRFILNAFFPTLVFGLVLGLVILSGTAGVDAAVSWWDARRAVIQTLLVIGGVAAVFVVANLIANNVLWVTQLFEGYAQPAALLAGGGRRYHLWRSRRAKDADQRYPLYPPTLGPDDVAPTRLGNLLLNAETYPRQRYGVDSIRVWPRLYHLLPADFRSSMNDSRASMEFMLVVAFWGGLFAPAGSICLLCFGASTGWVLGALFGGATVAALGYFGALAPAAIYGGHVRTAFDLHRLELLAALRVPIPGTLTEEARTWPLVVRFLGDGTEYGWRYVSSK